VEASRSTAHEGAARPAAPEKDQLTLISRSTSARELLRLHAKYGEAFDSIHFATCWSRLGKVSASDRTWLRSDDGARLATLREQTRDRVQKFDAQAVSNTAHAIAKLWTSGARRGEVSERRSRGVVLRSVTKPPMGGENGVLEGPPQAPPEAKAPHAKILSVFTP